MAFFLYSFALGTLFPRLGDLQLQMGLSEGELGLSLVGAPIGVQLSLLVANHVVARFSLAKVMITGLAVIMAVYVATAVAGSPALFFALLFVMGLSVGILEVAVNLEADRVEYGLKQRIMNRAHAFWSLGFFATGLLGAVMAQLGVSVLVHFAGFGLAVVVVTVLVFSGYIQAPFRPSAETATPKFVKPTAAIMVLVCLTLSAMLAEGSAIEWSVIYMRDVFATLPLVNGMALALTAFAQFLTRYFADRFVDRHGPRRVAGVCVWIMLAGVILVAAAPVWSVALLGFTCLGAGSSVIFPLAMSAAAQLEDRPAAVNVASLAQISFVVFLLSPPVLGLVAEHIGIRYAFALCLPLTILSLFSLHGLAAKPAVSAEQ
ncbi:MAG: MFS transporter [Candidatus Puniceispirillaceae bacterium]